MLMDFIVPRYITKIDLDEYQNILLIDTFLWNLFSVIQLLLTKCCFLKPDMFMEQILIPALSVIQSHSRSPRHSPPTLAT